MNELYVLTNTTCTHSEYSDEPYGDWSADYDFDVNGVSLEKPNSSYEQFQTCFDVQNGDTVYVLSMIYSTGDSFGRSSGNGEALWVFKDFEVAKKAAQAIKDQEDKYSVSFLNENGEKATMSNPGSGYFECVEDIRLESFIIGQGLRMSFK